MTAPRRQRTIASAAGPSAGQPVPRHEPWQVSRNADKGRTRHYLCRSARQMRGQRNQLEVLLIPYPAIYPEMQIRAEPVVTALSRFILKSMVLSL